MDKFNSDIFEEKLSQIDKNGVIFYRDEYKEKIIKKTLYSTIYFHMYKDYELHYTQENDYDVSVTYIPERRFDYYIGISRSIYKKLKDFIKIEVLLVNEGEIEYHEYPFNNISRFTKFHKKKKYSALKSMIYIKLRAFNNTFIPYLRIQIPKEKLYEFVKDQTQLFNYFAILQKPVTKKYQNHIELYTKHQYINWNYKRDKVTYIMEEFPMKNNLTVQLVNFRIHKKYTENFIDIILKEGQTQFDNFNGKRRVAVFKIFDEDDKKEEKTIYFKITLYD